MWVSGQLTFRPECSWALCLGVTFWPRFTATTMDKVSRDMLPYSLLGLSVAGVPSVDVAVEAEVPGVRVPDFCHPFPERGEKREQPYIILASYPRGRPRQRQPNQ